MSGHRVGVVGVDGDGGDGGDADGGNGRANAPSIQSAVADAGGDPVVATADAVKDVDWVVAVGETAVVDLARRRVEKPVLPVDAGAGVESVERRALPAAVEAVLADDCPTRRHPVVSASVGSASVGPESVRAVFDVATMAAEPARISEYSVLVDGERVSRFRADGVVASTPAGSPGYNRSAGGPLLYPDTDVLSLVPVAPFATAADRWILPLSGAELRVERDETPVELLVDGRTEATLANGDGVALAHEFDLETFACPGRRQYVRNGESD